ncbi:hypothetical protein J3R83DRAFT_6592 [Lanmaoa asiatica]|nr:hypothetical protein J3R83DRAFT_6592 [Lanmaoa asiatica]
MMAGVYIAITFIAPGVLVWAQKYKKYVINLTLFSTIDVYTSPAKLEGRGMSPFQD